MNGKTEDNSSNSRYYTILVLFFFSGACALTYQVIWVKMAAQVFGVAPFAVSTVLSSFMAGLTVGSLWMGRAVDRLNNPLKLFGFMEAGIGGFALLFPLLLSKIVHSDVYLYLHLHTNLYLFSLMRFLIIFSLLLIPTFLMGGTLPVLSKFSIRSLKDLGRGVGSLYSVNNLGAAAGCFITGFFLIRSIGLANSIYLTAAINISIGVISVVLGRSWGDLKWSTDTREIEPPARNLAPVSEDKKETEHYGSFLVYTLLVVFTIGGFVSLVYEIIWTRILSASILSNSVYSFATVVITFILGLALGSLVYTRFMDKKRDRIALYGLVQAGIGISALLLLPAFGKIPFLVGLISPILFGSVPSWAMCIASEFVPSFLLMIVPTTLMGITFPLMSKIYTASLATLGRRMGEVNSLDTVGPVFGAFAGGFLFIPWLGMQKSVLVLSVLNIGMGALIIGLSPSTGRKLRWTFISILVLLTIAGSALIPSHFSFWRKGRIPGEKIVYYNEDAVATVVVREYPEGGRLNRVMEVDGTDVAGTDYMLRSTQKLQGHVPLLIHEAPKKVLIVGLGSGGTTWAVSQHDIEKIDVVELVPSVVEAAAEYFTDINHGVIADPRVNIKIGDGRNHVITTPVKYDVILTESIHPIYAGNGNLYSLEYFKSCIQKLGENGVMSVWVPLWALPEPDLKTIIETFRQVFPHCTLWYVANSLNRQVYLIGTKNKLGIDFKSIRARMSQEKINRDLEEIGMNDPFLLISSFIMGEDSIKAYAEGARINSDNHPLLEYFSYPYLEFFPSESFHVRAVYENLSGLLQFKGEVAPFLTNLWDDEEAEHIRDQLNTYSRSTEHTMRGIIYTLRGEIQRAIQEFGRAFEINPRDQSARRQLTQLLEYAYLDRGNEFQYRGDMDAAIVSYKKALEVNPNSAIAMYNLGLAYLRKGMREEAKIQLRKALQIDPEMRDAARELSQLGTSDN